MIETMMISEPIRRRDAHELLSARAQLLGAAGWSILSIMEDGLRGRLVCHLCRGEGSAQRIDETRKIAAGPESVACERCGAAPGMACTTKSGAPADGPHAVRKRAGGA